MQCNGLLMIARGALGLALLPFLVSLSLADDPTSDRIDLRVLSTGNPGSERMRDFEMLLQQHFTAVTTADYREFKPNGAKDHDVVIFDWTTTYPRDEDGKITWGDGGFSSPRAPRLGRDFGRPTVLIGAAGGSICNQMQIAINWK